MAAERFADRVWRELDRVPSGRVVSYGRLAAAAGQPRAARAVGQLMAGNRDQRRPCHRVVRADGGLGGYNRGLAIKAVRLREEGIDIDRAGRVLSRYFYE